MRTALSQLEKGLTRILEVFLVAAMTLLVLDVVWGVFTRYALGEQAKWTEELARFLLVWVALLGGAVAFGRKAHLGVDYFVEALHPDARRMLTVIGHLVVLFFGGAIFLLGGFRLVSDALSLEQVTPALGWKMGYVYMVVPISGFFMVLFSLQDLVNTLGQSKTKSARAARREEPS